MKTYKIKNKKINGVDMVCITVGASELQLTEEEAYSFSEAVENAANRRSFEEHIDNIFDNWGTEGSTC